MRRLGWILLVCLSLQSRAGELEVIQLQNRSVSEVLPVLQPLLEPGATLTGMNDQLILRASDRNRAEIKKVLATLDQASRQLVIYVRQSMTQDRQQRGINATGTVVLGNGASISQPVLDSGHGPRTVRPQTSSVDINVQDRQRRSQDAADQMVRVMDGGSAYISAGVSVPIPMRSVYLSSTGAVITESTVYQDLASGFYATPRLMGERVSIDISPQQNSPQYGVYGTQAVQRLYTTVQTRLGEWVQIGGAGTSTNRQSRQLFGGNNQTSMTQRSVWLKVEAE
ncbi:hypothetical protein CAP31_10910 [Sulfuriferula sp. AH1]|uniref:secretin N-terminal domain-containing protein n=1 Tax=Sulfuriferula sp. AH1 TaxID=1985873 RepID=UPI000B3B15B4|nr:secretin N-terminal domain-containing protein [Sulfuriferula sp. AH1]ARU32143.1 hypothetical protein CAP31_10910 [Sulfuriferula sp. AH1]